MTNIKAKKRFGQNFLKDDNVLIEIIQSMPQNNNHLVEIGPGLGDLTKKLVKCKDVTAYEVDRDLYSILQKEFQEELDSNKLNIILGDVLEKWNQNNSLYNSKYDMIANLPYYIATNIILNAYEDENCEHIIVMVQKEVADKFTASFRPQPTVSVKPQIRTTSTSPTQTKSKVNEQQHGVVQSPTPQIRTLPALTPKTTTTPTEAEAKAK